MNPMFLKSASVKVDGTEQADLVSNVTITPASSAITFKGISGQVSQSTGSETWTCSLTYAQDYTTPDSLALTLFNRAGETVPVVFTPTAGEGPSITVQATLVAGPIGGAVDATAEGTVALPVTGRPQIGTIPAAA